MKPTTQDIFGTSFHGVTLQASLEGLTQKIGKPHKKYPLYDTVQCEWDFETEEGHVFTVYDWKEYRIYDAHLPLHWHIGAHSKAICQKALEELKALL